jgi:putative DNA primase/helicase
LAGEELPSRGETRERDLATQFLRDLLRDGPVPSKQVEADAKANGITQRTLWRAKADMGIAAARLPGQRGAWFWSLPGEAT